MSLVSRCRNLVTWWKPSGATHQALPFWKLLGTVEHYRTTEHAMWLPLPLTMCSDVFKQIAKHQQTIVVSVFDYTSRRRLLAG